jgi:hypothetical protein
VRLYLNQTATQSMYLQTATYFLHSGKEITENVFSAGKSQNYFRICCFNNQGPWNRPRLASYEIRSGQSVIGTVLLRVSSVFLYLHHSTIAAHSSVTVRVSSNREAQVLGLEVWGFVCDPKLRRVQTTETVSMRCMNWEGTNLFIP